MRLGRALIGGLVLVALLPQAAFAQGPLYGGVDVGVIIPQGMSARLSGAITGNGHLSLNAAGAVAGVVGYDLTDRLSAEGELGWSLYDPSKLSGSLTSGGAALPDLALNGDFNTVFALANALYRPWGRLGRFTPYLGGGIGLAYRDWSITTQPNAAASLSLKGTAVDFAADAVLGLDYAVTPRFSLGGRYRFLWIDSDGGSVSGGGVTLTHGNTYAHLLTATLTYRF